MLIVNSATDGSAPTTSPQDTHLDLAILAITLARLHLYDLSEVSLARRPDFRILLRF